MTPMMSLGLLRKKAKERFSSFSVESQGWGLFNRKGEHFLRVSIHAAWMRVQILTINTTA